MELKKAFDFVEKYKSYIFLPMICILQFLACFFHDFWIFATILAIILLLISDFAHILYYLLFFQMFSAVGNFSLITTFFGAGFICAKYIIGLIRKTEKFYPVPFILTCVICLIFSLHFTKIDSKGIYHGASLIATLFVIYLLFTYREKIKISKCADYLIYGILATAGISLLTMFFDGSLFSFFDGSGEFKRLKLLTANENSLAIYCSLALSIFVSNIINGKGNIYKNIILGVSSIIFGLQTLSKCFLIICIFIILYLFIMLILKYKLKSFLFILPAILILIAVSFAMQTKIDAIIERFFLELDKKLSLSIITTGRSDLWTIYINHITSSISNMLFGVGFFNEKIVTSSPHNLWIYLLYRMGFVGIMMLGILAYYYYKNSHKTLKITIKNCLPILVFLLISMVENFL